MKDMLAELNHMLEQRERGEEPDFEGFMDRFGDFFPENPQTLDELLEQMARSMAQMQQLLNSMTPEQRAQLQELANSLLDDMDLRWQVDQLGQNLRNAFPQMGWGQQMRFRGDEPLPLEGMSGLLDELGDIDALENLMRNATSPGPLAEVDLDKVRDLLGDDAARSLQQLAKIAKELEEAGLIEQREGRMELTPKGIRRIGQRALGDLYKRLLQDRAGKHEIERSGVRARARGRAQALRVRRPVPSRRRTHAQERDHASGRGNSRRDQARGLRDRAHRAGDAQRDRAHAGRLPLDGDARPVPRGEEGRDGAAHAHQLAVPTRLPGHGELRAGRARGEAGAAPRGDLGLRVGHEHAARVAAWPARMLARQTGRKQIIMITDGEPTAHILDNGEPFFDYPPDPRTIEMTLREVQRCTKDGIRINTFMLEDNFYLREFVERMMRMNRGRAFYTTPETLGDYVLVDFLEQRRHERRAG